MDNKKNIFLLIDCLNSFQGGAERQILELVKNLDKDKYRIFVGCLSRRDCVLKKMEEFGAVTVAFKVDRIYGLKGIRQGFQFADLLKKECVDILMTYHFGSDIWGTIFGKKAGISRIISNRRDAGFWRNGFHILAYRWVNRWVSKIVVVSKEIKDIVIRDERVRDKKIEAIHNGIDLARFEGLTLSHSKLRELNLFQNGKVIVCIGNLRPVKGHKFLIEAAKIVVGEIPDARFLLIGQGQLKDDLESMVDQFDLKNNFYLLGRRTDVPELLAETDVCVLPSLSEGLSNTLLEYMAAGKPIVATNAGGNPEVILDQINGLLVNTGDPKDIADKLLYLLRNSEECHRLGFKAKENAREHFAVQKMIERYENLFDKEEGENVKCHS